MTLCLAYYTITDPEEPVHHVYDDCPRGRAAFNSGNAWPGTNGYPLCPLCARKNATGEFSDDGEDSVRGLGAIRALIRRPQKRTG